MPLSPPSFVSPANSSSIWTPLPDMAWTQFDSFGDYPIVNDTYFASEEAFVERPVNFRFGLQRALTDFSLTSSFPSAFEAPEENYRYCLKKFEQRLALFDQVRSEENPERFKQYVRQLYRDATVVYQKYALIRTEHQSETILGREYFVNLLYDMIKTPSAKGQGPVVACIRLPMTAWNKLGGHAVGDIFRAGVMTVARKFFGAAASGQFVYTARVNIGLIFPGDEFDPGQLSNFLETLWNQLEGFLRQRVASDASSVKGKLRMKQGVLEVYSFTSKYWLPFSSFAHEFKAGVVQSPLLSMSADALKQAETRSFIAGLVDSLRNQALTRAEHLAYTKASKAIDFGTEELTRFWSEFPQGIYMSPDEVLRSLKEFAHGRDRAIIETLGCDYGLSPTSAKELTQTLVQSQVTRVTELSRVQQDFVHFVYEALGRSASPAILHFALKAGLIPRLNHEVGRFSRPDGVLNQLGSSINDPEKKLDWAWVQKELTNLKSLANQALCELTNDVALKEKFYDESVLAYFEETADVTDEAYVFGIDIDHLKDFFSQNNLNPDQLVDQKMLEILRLPQTAFEAYARELGIDAKGFLLKFGDEIVFTFPRKGKKADGTVVEIGPQNFAHKLRQMLREGFARYIFPYTEKIKVGEDIQRLPLYDVHFTDGTKARLVCDAILGPTANGDASLIVHVLSGPKKTLLNKPIALALAFPGKIIREFERIEGGLDLTMAFTNLCLRREQLYEQRLQIFNSVRKQALDHTDVMKASGRRSATDYLDVRAAMSARPHSVPLGRVPSSLYLQQADELRLTAEVEKKNAWKEQKVSKIKSVTPISFATGDVSFRPVSTPASGQALFRHDLNLVVSGSLRGPVDSYARTIRRQRGPSHRPPLKLGR